MRVDGEKESGYKTITGQERIECINGILDDVTHCHSKLAILPEMTQAMLPTDLSAIEDALMPLLEAGAIGIDARNRIVAFISDILHGVQYDSELKTRFEAHVREYSAMVLAKTEGKLPLPVEYIYVMSDILDRKGEPEIE